MLLDELPELALHRMRTEDVHAVLRNNTPLRAYALLCQPAFRERLRGVVDALRCEEDDMTGATQWHICLGDTSYEIEQHTIDSPRAGSLGDWMAMTRAEKRCKRPEGATKIIPFG